MYPTIKEGEFHIFCKIFYQHNLTGIIVSFHYNSTILVGHRVIMDNGTHILTKGDNNIYSDGWFNKNLLVGWFII